MPTPNRIAAVSLALQELIEQAMPAGVEVTTLSLSVAEQFAASDTVYARVNLALIRIAVAETFRNAPGRTGPTVTGTPPLALEVHYLVTSYSEAGPAAEHSVERLLEAVLQQLKAHPVLSTTELKAALSGADIKADVNVALDSRTDSEMRDVLVGSGARCRPALAYCARLTQ